jgi:hypothetical protein
MALLEYFQMNRGRGGGARKLTIFFTDRPRLFWVEEQFEK